MGRSYTWDGGIPHIRRTLEDINCKPVIQSRVLITGDINAYSPVWNLHCHKKQNASVLEESIDQFGLLINNKPGCSTWPISQGISVIVLAIFMAERGPLTLWGIPEDYRALSDYKLILLRWENMDVSLSQPNTSRAIG